MLYLMRKYATSWLIKVLLGAIVVVFVLWGVGSYKSQKTTRVALVNGETITLEEYKQTYSNLIEQLRLQFGNQLNDELIEMFQIKKQALNQLIDKRLLLKEAARMKFKASDDELTRSIRSMGAFQTAGVFNSRLYKNVLNLNRTNPEQFEASQRESLLVNKVKSFIEANAKVSESEARDWYNWQSSTVSISYVLFDPNRYENINSSSEEIKAFYDKRKENYKTDPKLKVRYLSFKTLAYSPLVKIAESDLQDYYDSNPEEFEMPKTVEVRHILIKVDQTASAQLVEEARLRALSALKIARQGKDFAELAKKLSEGPTKDTGGYIGKFKRNDMIKPFADKAFSMKAGEISDPVKTQFGWHVIKVESVDEARTLPLPEAKDKIRKQLTEEKARSLAFDAAEAAFNASFEGDSLEKVAEAQKITFKITDFFTRQGPVKGIQDASAFVQAAFKLSDDDFSDVQDFGDGYYILQVADRIKARIPTLDNIKEKIIADLVKEKQAEKAKKDAGTLLASVKKGKPFAEESKKFNLTVADTPFFKRNDSIPGIGYDQNIAGAAFKLTEKKRFPEEILKGSKGIYVIRYKERKMPDSKGFEKEKAQIIENQLKNKKIKVFNEWLSNLRGKSEISIEEEFKE